MGIDIASCTGMALVGEEEGRGKTLNLQKEKGFLRLKLMAEAVHQTIVVWNPEIVVIEDYAFIKNFETLLLLVEFGTIIRQVLYEHHRQWIEVKPSTLKKWTTGKGNATKEAMAVAVQERWQYQSPSHDVIDAYALAQMGQLGYDTLLQMSGVSKGL